jgi:hypothetical protein
MMLNCVPICTCENSNRVSLGSFGAALNALDSKNSSDISESLILLSVLAGLFGFGAFEGA